MTVLKIASQLYSGAPLNSPKTTVDNNVSAIAVISMRKLGEWLTAGAELYRTMDRVLQQIHDVFPNDPTRRAELFVTYISTPALHRHSHDTLELYASLIKEAHPHWECLGGFDPPPSSLLWDIHQLLETCEGNKQFAAQVIQLWHPFLPIADSLRCAGQMWLTLAARFHQFYMQSPEEVQLFMLQMVDFFKTLVTPETSIQEVHTLIKTLLHLFDCGWSLEAIGDTCRLTQEFCMHRGVRTLTEKCALICALVRWSPENREILLEHADRLMSACQDTLDFLHNSFPCPCPCPCPCPINAVS